ncbi:MAG: diguanylate cyclase [Proteobacteria bacterium]|nr:diguanylate cyclase [Pseudomonadota bacterium]
MTRLLPSWEKAATNLLGILHLNSIKSKIIVFALLATLIPSLTMGWLSYVHNRLFLDEKINQELLNATSQASRELDLWLKEHVYEVRVFSSSYVVSENLEKLLRPRLSRLEKTMANRRLMDYLKSVKEKFIDYEELMVIDASGKVVATSFEGETNVTMPQDWRKRAQARKSIISSPFLDQTHKTGVMVIAEPIAPVHDQFLGVLAAKLNFRGIAEILKNYSLDKTDEIYLINKEGALLVSSQPLSSGFMEDRLKKSTAALLYAREAVRLNYSSHNGRGVVGTLKKVSQMDFGVVAEKEREKAYADISELHNLTIALVAGLLLVIGLMAYLLGLTIVYPLNRLISGADKVSAGDLDFDLPVMSGGEVGHMTRVFNHMVGRLRESRAELDAINETLRERNKELHEISIRDSLTSLYNRRHLMETLSTEVTRSRRYRRPFALLMIDIDHFKQYNDTYGHLAGDDVLRMMAAAFKNSVRGCDYAARYGGEEFAMMLPETGPDGAMQTAERIRTKVEKELFTCDEQTVKITVSIGISTFPENGDDLNALISSADAALYQAKEEGRNRVILSENKRSKSP